MPEQGQATHTKCLAIKATKRKDNTILSHKEGKVNIRIHKNIKPIEPVMLVK